MAVSGVACRWTGGVEEMSLGSSFVSVHLTVVLKASKVPEAWMEAGILFQVASETTKECWWKSEDA